MEGQDRESTLQELDSFLYFKHPEPIPLPRRAGYVPGMALLLPVHHHTVPLTNFFRSILKHLTLSVA